MALCQAAGSLFAARTGRRSGEEVHRDEAALEEEVIIHLAPRDLREPHLHIIPVAPDDPIAGHRLAILELNLPGRVRLDAGDDLLDRA